jgi:hypothetical protein
MIHLKLRQAGWLVNYKRVELPYKEVTLQVRRRKWNKSACRRATTPGAAETRQWGLIEGFCVRS